MSYETAASHTYMAYILCFSRYRVFSHSPSFTHTQHATFDSSIAIYERYRCAQIAIAVTFFALYKGNGIGQPQ